jgi:hypothetical protein
MVSLIDTLRLLLPAAGVGFCVGIGAFKFGRSGVVAAIPLGLTLGWAAWRGIVAIIDRRVMRGARPGAK